MKQAFLSCIALICLVLGLPQATDARPQRVNQIPNGSTFGCLTCHNSSSGGSRNVFGQAVPLSGSGGGATVQWSASFAALDSDGDGVTNGVELGDPDGDGNPQSGVTVTNPGDPSSFTLPNAAPTLASIDPQTALEGQELSFDVTASDTDGDDVSIAATGLPEGALFEDGRFSWTPDFVSGGTVASVTFTASDGSDEASLVVEISVTDVNRPVALDTVSPSRNLVVGMAGEMLTFTVDAADPDGDGVTYAWSFNGADDAESTGTFTVTLPDGSQDHTVIVTATSADGTEATQSWTVTPALVGDFDGSNDVGFTDFLLFTGQFGKTSADADFDQAFDLDNDGSVGFLDFLRFADFFGLTV